MPKRKLPLAGVRWAWGKDNAYLILRWPESAGCECSLVVTSANSCVGLGEFSLAHHLTRRAGAGRNYRCYISTRTVATQRSPRYNSGRMLSLAPVSVRCDASRADPLMHDEVRAPRRRSSLTRPYNASSGRRSAQRTHTMRCTSMRMPLVCHLPGYQH